MNSSKTIRPEIRGLYQLELDVQVADGVQSEPWMTNEQLSLWIEETLKFNGFRGEAQISVRLVNEPEIADLNLRYRQKSGATNVLAFPYEIVPDFDIALLGDLVICIPVLQREAREQNKQVQSHFAHLLVHGTLHLMGYDHLTESDALHMEGAERSILQHFGISDPYGEIEEQ